MVEKYWENKMTNDVCKIVMSVFANPAEVHHQEQGCVSIFSVSLHILIAWHQF